jgi:flavin reductase (DIM6/NTAB) family NADH-FMN oxidoreductase RutF
MSSAPAPSDPITDSDFKTTLAQFATGITVMTAQDAAGRPHGLTATSFSSLSLDPPLIQWSLRRQAWSYPVFKNAARFAVNILAADQESVSRTFASPIADRFAVTPHKISPGGLPIIDGVLAWLECELEAELPGGDHSIFVGRVLSSQVNPKAPLLHWQGQYSALAS